MIKTCKDVVSFIIIDDHPIFRKGLAYLINSEEGFEVIGEASTFEETILLIENERFDFAIIDISLNGKNGLELVKILRHNHPDTYCLVLSMYDEAVFATRSLNLGAQGYVMKSEDPSCVISAIKTIIDGKIYLSPDMEDTILTQMVDSIMSKSFDPIQRLSDREFEIFRLIGKGYKPHQIAEKLYLKPGTIETYRKSLKKKLHMKNAIELRQFAIEWSNNNISN
ncbi:MAG: response regulator transcription factor [Spirochaetales bacterium]|nr:response regulator transcription factor [Spirochaetales bacterium]